MLFDVYQSKDIDNKGKSLALGLTFQHASRTLTDEEINKAIDRVVKKLDNKFKAELRGWFKRWVQSMKLLLCGNVTRKS